MTTRTPARPLVTGGVDTHRDEHVAAGLDHNGGLLATASFPTTAAGYAALLAWLLGLGDSSPVSSGVVWESVVGYSRAVRVGPWVSVAGTTAAAEGGGAVGGRDIAAQAREALRRIAVVLEEAGAGLQDVVRTRMFVTDITRWREVGQVHGEVFGAIRPATSMLEVSALIDPALLVEIEADAVVP